MIEAIFFDLHGTLVDTDALITRYREGLGPFMAARYGGTPAAWMDANARILADWDSYWADLDVNGENGLDDYWEGQFRTMRALFRLAGSPEPDRDEIWSLVRSVDYAILHKTDVLYADVRACLESIHAGRRIGIISNAHEGRIRGILEGGGVRDFFDGPIIGMERMGQIGKDTGVYRRVLRSDGLHAANALVVDDQPDGVIAAAEAGIRVIFLVGPGREDKRAGVEAARASAAAVLPGLDSLPNWIEENTKETAR